MDDAPPRDISMQDGKLRSRFVGVLMNCLICTGSENVLDPDYLAHSWVRMRLIVMEIILIERQNVALLTDMKTNRNTSIYASSNVNALMWRSGPRRYHTNDPRRPTCMCDNFWFWLTPTALFWKCAVSTFLSHFSEQTISPCLGGKSNIYFVSSKMVNELKSASLNISLL